MKLRTAVTLAQAALVAIILTALSTTSHAQDAERTVNLGTGCNMVTLTFTDGTDATTVAGAVLPTEALDTIWRLDNSTGSFQAFTPTAPAASDLQSVELLDAVFHLLADLGDGVVPALLGLGQGLFGLLGGDRLGFLGGGRGVREHALVLGLLLCEGGLE